MSVHFEVNNLRDKKILKKFGDNLRKIRKERNLTLQTLANKAEMELSQIHRIEKGQINPTLTTLAAIGKVLNLSLSELLNF